MESDISRIRRSIWFIRDSYFHERLDFLSLHSYYVLKKYSSFKEPNRYVGLGGQKIMNLQLYPFYILRKKMKIIKSGFFGGFRKKSSRQVLRIIRFFLLNFGRLITARILIIIEVIKRNTSFCSMKYEILRLFKHTDQIKFKNQG